MAKEAVKLERVEQLLSELRVSLKDAIKANHRRMLVICGRDNDKLAFVTALAIKVFVEIAWRKLGEIRGLYAYKPKYEDAQERLHKVRSLIKKFISQERVVFKLEPLNYADTDRVLGTTYEMAVLDLINDMRPNDVGRLVGIIRGGGLLILITPPFNEWEKYVTEFQELLSTPQHPVHEVRHIFKKRIIKKFFEHKGIIIYDADKDKILRHYDRTPIKAFKRKEITIPEKTIFPTKAYKLALTQDQVEVLKILERLVEKPRKGEKYAVVIIADRGRGKSCAVGIGLASLAHKLRRIKGGCKITVTAPSLSNVQSLMMLAKKTLEALNYDAAVHERRGMISEIRCKGISIRYYEPIDAINTQADIIAVDEAAGLQVPMLKKIWRKFDRAIFSSTIHGYEGAGRGFSVRFLKAIKEDPSTKVFEYEMEEPIRYAMNDPIERWLFDTLLLDAEPAELEDEDFILIRNKRLRYVKPNLEEWFLGSKESKLREFVGIYILAHYRNRPNDVAMMADAPHHTIRALELENGKIVVAVELAEEGPIPKDMIDYLKYGGWIHGNIIPDRFLKHCRDERFAKYAGWRIVRIATHPNAMDRGLGTYMLSKLCEEARELGYGWVGAGFGVNYPLLKFWVKNGFIPIHISPDRNPVSGEYTVLVVKPLNSEVEKIILEANREFRRRLLLSLVDPYDDLDPRVAQLLLKPWLKEEPPHKPEFTKVMLERTISFAYGAMTYECCSDCIRELAFKYFLNSEKNRPKLSEIEELILIVKVLQARSWRYTCEELGLESSEAVSILKDAVRRILRFYFNVEKPEHLK